MEKYYKDTIQFAMMDFVSKVTNKYVEYVREVESEYDADVAQEFFREFENWLYKIMKH